MSSETRHFANETVGYLETLQSRSLIALSLATEAAEATAAAARTAQATAQASKTAADLAAATAAVKAAEVAKAAEDKVIRIKLPAAHHIHRALNRLLDYLADEIKPSGSEESTGQIDTPGSDPDPRRQDFSFSLLAWIRALEQALLAKLGEVAREEDRLFVDHAVHAAHHLVEARKLLESESD